MSYFFKKVIINISYWTVWCVVSWDIFTSHAVFWQARWASQNTRAEKQVVSFSFISRFDTSPFDIRRYDTNSKTESARKFQSLKVQFAREQEYDIFLVLYAKYVRLFTPRLNQLVSKRLCIEATANRRNNVA